jgi:hypothetical protein
MDECISHLYKHLYTMHGSIKETISKISNLNRRRLIHEIRTLSRGKKKAFKQAVENLQRLSMEYRTWEQELEQSKRKAALPYIMLLCDGEDKGRKSEGREKYNGYAKGKAFLEKILNEDFTVHLHRRQFKTPLIEGDEEYLLTPPEQFILTAFRVDFPSDLILVREAFISAFQKAGVKLSVPLRDQEDKNQQERSFTLRPEDFYFVHPPANFELLPVHTLQKILSPPPLLSEMKEAYFSELENQSPYCLPVYTFASLLAHDLRAKKKNGLLSVILKTNDLAFIAAVVTSFKAQLSVADINQPDKAVYGWTLLHKVIFAGHASGSAKLAADLGELLLTQGASLFTADSRGITPGGMLLRFLQPFRNDFLESSDSLDEAALMPEAYQIEWVASLPVEKLARGVVFF